MSRRAPQFSRTPQPREARVLGLLAMCGLLLGQVGCFETTFEKDPDSPFWDDVDAGVADDVTDTGGTDSAHDTSSTEDIATDAGPVDTSVDAGPVDSGAPDTGDEEDTEAPDAGPEDIGPPEDTGPPLAPLGTECQVDSECADGLCIKTTSQTSVCTRVCTGSCPEGFRCQLAPETGSQTLHYCMPMPGDLCDTCISDADCLGGLCLTMEGTGEKLCGLFCDAAAGGASVCPVGFDCQSFLTGELCVPTNNTCTCDTAKQGSFWPCGVKTPLGTCTGAQSCGEAGWTKCTAAFPKKELCNGFDDDCDGKTDEGFVASIDGVDVPLGGPCGKGVCAGGTVICATGGKDTACSTDLAFPPKDGCDKLDNDCDGQTDEDCPPKDTDADGTPDTKDCLPYNAEAFPGANEPCCLLPVKASETEYEVPVEPSFSGCDYNCDKVVKVCSSADKDGDGHPAPGDCNDGDPLVHPGGIEECSNGVDEDCTDGDLPCSQAGIDSDQDGYAAKPQGSDCNDNTKQIHPNAPEKCNFIDDDCDGMTDEGNPSAGCSDPAFDSKITCLTNGKDWIEAGAACGSTTGECKAGSRVCNHVGLVAQVTCVDALGAQAELCNNADDDCDGSTDEDYTDLGQACDGDDADLCLNGKNVCAPDGIGVACGLESKTDQIETCKPGDPPEGNGIDEDCDGVTDEICFGQDSDGDGSPKGVDCNDADSSAHPGIKNEPCCDPALKGTDAEKKACDKNCDGVSTFCAAADKDLDGYSGADDCDETNPNRHHKGIEKCGDGIDQDCDNEDLSCDKITDNDGDFYASALDCNDFDPDIHPHAVESCNHKDDDCDGITDEENAGAQAGACGSSLGECKPGKEVCVFQKLKSVLLCVPEVAPSAELCNAKDDNCNGKVDEYFPQLGKPCDGPDSDSCANGTWTCAPDGNGVACNNEVTADIVELCDGIDNDCDGETDEGHVYFGKKVGDSCTGLGACGEGTVVCSPELQVAVCSTDAYGTEPKSQTEVCDGLDNDCDGLTDEGMTFNGKKIGEQCLGNGACAGEVGKVQCAKAGGDAATQGAAICSTMLGGDNYKGTPEKCNGIDDNCDGHVDEGMKVSDSDCKQSGICENAGVKARCKGGNWECKYDAVVGYQGDKEVFCDGVDNDCDGQTDDEFAIGIPCDGTDTDLCAFGQRSCNPDKLGSTCGPETKSNLTEKCDGADNDCDGKTDEDYPVGEKCDGADSDKCANGTWTCASDFTGAECVNEKLTDLKDDCNGIDDDCDGKTDEDFPNLGKACDGDDSDKCANGKTTCSGDGKKEVCGAETKTNIVDVCNGKDDDCNGKTDDDVTYNTYADDNGKKSKLAATCKGQGGCGEGKTVCQPKVPFKATCSTNPDAFLIFEGKELCDGLDNDCDGQTDNGLAWKGVAKGQTCAGVGICGAGVVECGTDKNVTCSTLANGSKPQASKETCNDKDDDCDGAVDEDIPLAESTCRSKGVCAADADGKTPVVFACDGKNAKWTCDYSKVAGYEKEETLCDGIDNDCDGQTDEGFFIGEACDGDDKDQCKTGTWRCSGDKAKAVCDNETLQDIPEVCDAKDNDCDGQTDEEFTYSDEKLTVGTTCDGVGECGSGKVMCHSNLPIAVCSTDPGGKDHVAKVEACNAKDDDCDGKTDNGFVYNGLPVGANCTGVGACGLGQVECNPKTNQTVCSSNPDGSASNAVPELCDKLDNNCDGAVDNAVDAKTTSCNTAGQCSKALATQCVEGKWTCAYSGASWEKDETLCDDLDNDCDGKTDEPFTAKASACDGPDDDKCKNGLLECSSSHKSLVCGTEKPTSPIELCDGLDNDCNGKTDDPFPELGKDCDGSDTDSCANGSFTCSSDGKNVQCINEFPTSIKELCDGKDNDCDGETDEDFKIGKPCDGPDADKCEKGVWICGKDGKPLCDEKANAVVKEICDDLDNDCDGQTDEGFALKGFACDGADTDKCSTGTYGCANGALQCLGDFECAVGSECKKGDGAKGPDQCQCSGAPCSFAEGDVCKANKCLCNDAAACGFTQICDPGVGCKNP